MAKTYFKKLQDPRWQKKRLEALEDADWRCQYCYESEDTLHVHHKAYFKGREPWEYDTDQLAVLCKDCHEGLHKEDPFMEAVSRIPMDGPDGRGYFTYLIAGALSLDNISVPSSMLEQFAYEQGRELYSDLLKKDGERRRKEAEARNAKQ